MGSQRQNDFESTATDDDQPKQSESLLVQALQVTAPIPFTEEAPSSNSSITFHSSSNLTCDPIIPVHSDFTIPTSNVSSYMAESIVDGSASRRTVFGGRLGSKYGVYNPPSTMSILYGSLNENGDESEKQQPPMMKQQQALWSNAQPTSIANTERHINHRAGAARNTINGGFDPDLTPPSSPKRSSNRRYPQENLLTPPPKRLNSSNGETANGGNGSNDDDMIDDHHDDHNHQPVHETVHAQSLILGLAFMAIWSPQNCMAPNLTQMAADFEFSDKERDFYLGSVLALATGVLSLPISAGIGILADVYNRKYLFCGTVAMGGLSALLTGSCRTYRWLFVARLLNGSFMSGSVPVAFSLLGDLFDTNERNAASSGLTAMMGLGIISGQVYAGVVGSSEGWSHAFYVSSGITLVTAVLVFWLVREPIRGGKEEVLQDMLRHGTRYERKLTWKAFVTTMRNNESNMIIMWQGFFSSIPWGIIFVFLNDYLSQERGFSVPDATYLVAVFGIGCAVGGILGGYWGGMFQAWNRTYLPLFMSGTTFLGIFPFLGLLNGRFTNAHGYQAVGYAFFGGFVASLPSVCVRPCLINVNPPETRGAALTAANLIIQLARGAGPSSITLLGAILKVDRQHSFNITLSVFWTITAIQLLFLSKTLPRDQDAMDADLAQYAATALAQRKELVEEKPLVSTIEDRMTSWDGDAARESMQFVFAGFKEIGEEFRTYQSLGIGCGEQESDEEETQEEIDRHYVERRRQVWIQQQMELTRATRVDKPDPDENTPLV